ncbi:MAG: aspartate 1-decarboxylase [Ignavibacteriae bacterium]|nr:aspartate 1-decarboxylase [Ignavibacteriota bacterium]
MLRTLLKSKIHRAVVTGSYLNYEGSISIDKKLMIAADLIEFEKVDVYNINNGERFSTYVIEGDDGEISLNGAAARLVQIGDLIIIASFVSIENELIKSYKPNIVLVDKNNCVLNFT